MNNIISVNGVDLTPFLKSYYVGIMDLDADSSRTVNGTLIRNRIAVKRRIELEFCPLSRSDCARVLNALSDTFLAVTYLDPALGSGSVTKRMYVSDRTVPFLAIERGFWDGLSFTLTEG